MTTTGELLVDEITAPDAAFNQSPGVPCPLQLRAAQEVFEQRVEQMRFGPTLLDSISRFAQPGEQDHIGGAGTIDSHMSGTVGGPQPFSGAG